MPFTAWDVYAWFYIGDKAFGDWEPWLMPQNADKDIIVINNYTLSIHFDYWAPFAWYWLASQSITTPWPVWEKVVNELKTMNASQAWTFGHTNITEMVVPYWALSPYYVTYVSPSTIVIQLEPMYFDGRPLLAGWDKIFPVHTWQYYPKIIDYYTLTSYTSAVALALKDKDVWLPSWDPTPNYVSTLMSAGEYTVTLPDIANFGVTFPWYYPFNIPQVRQAFLYIINRTEAALAWTTLNYTVPIYINIPTPAPNAEPGFWLTLPEDIRAMGINFTQPNWTKATQLLESAGLYYKNGQWYLPNGTPLTLTFYITGTGWWPTVTQAVALQLSQFGIKTSVVSLEASTYYSLEVSCGLPAYGDWAYAGAKGGYPSQWSTYSGIQWISLDLYAGGWCAPGHTTPFAFPNIVDNRITGWYCQPVTTNLPIPNNTIVWCINSTFGYFNLSNWEHAISATAPGSSTYHELVKVLSAWYLYWVPAVTISQIMLGQTFPKSMVDPMWAYDCMPYTNPKYTAAAYSLFHDWATARSGGFGLNPELNILVYMGAFAPPGQIPPLAQAIINGSLWTNPELYKWAVFIGLPTPDPELQACVASYFHTTYTPVTTTTTTTSTTTTTTTTATTTAVSTVTSTATVTSTVTTTAVSTTTTATTVTVTKPVISTALVIGIVVVVIVIAAVVAVIALRRR